MEAPTQVEGNLESRVYGRFLRAAIAEAWIPEEEIDRPVRSVYGVGWEELRTDTPENANLAPHEHLQHEIDAIRQHNDPTRPALIVATTNRYIDRKMAVKIVTAMTAEQPIVYAERLVPQKDRIESHITTYFADDVPPAVKNMILKYAPEYKDLVLSSARMSREYAGAWQNFHAPQLDEQEKTQATQAAADLIADYQKRFVGIKRPIVTSVAEMKTGATTSGYEVSLAAARNPHVIQQPTDGRSVASGVPNQPVTNLGDAYTQEVAGKVSLAPGKIRMDKDKKYDETLLGSLGRMENLRAMLRQEFGINENDELYIIDREGTFISLELISLENGIRIEEDSKGKKHVMDFCVGTIQARVNGHIMTVIQEGRALEMPWEAYELSKASNFTKPVGHYATELWQQRYGHLYPPNTKFDPQDVHTVLYGMTHGLKDLRKYLLLETIVAGISRFRDPKIRQEYARQNPSGRRQKFEPVYLDQEEPIREVQVKVHVSDQEADELIALLQQKQCILSTPEQQTDRIFTPPGHIFPPKQGTTTHRLRTIRKQSGEEIYTHTVKTVRGTDELKKTAHEIRLYGRDDASRLVDSWRQEEYQEQVTVVKSRQEGDIEDASIRLDRVEGVDGVIVELAGHANIVAETTIETRLLFLLRKLGLGKAGRIRQGLDTIIYNKEHGTTDANAA